MKPKIDKVILIRNHARQTEIEFERDYIRTAYLLDYKVSRYIESMIDNGDLRFDMLSVNPQGIAVYFEVNY